jgi:hypothetical protein
LSSGFNSILVVKDHLSKCVHYLPCLTTINAPETADLFFCEIFRLHGVPKTIVSDRGPQFVMNPFRDKPRHLDNWRKPTLYLLLRDSVHALPRQPLLDTKRLLFSRTPKRYIYCGH